MRIGLFLFLCILAVAGGLGWGAWEYQKDTKTPVRQIVDGMRGAAAGLNKPGETPAGDPGKPDPGQPNIKNPPDKPDPGKPDPGQPKPPDPTPISGSDPAIVAIVDEGKRLYAEGQYGAAKRKFLQALSGRLAPEELRKVEVLQRNSALFQSLIDQVNPADILPVDRRGTVYLANGGVINGVIEKESPSGIEIRKDNGIVARFSMVQVDRIEKQTKESVLEALEKEYALRVEGMGPKGTGLDYYELAVFCIKNQLADRVTPLLEKAVTLDRNVMEAATETKAKLLYDTFVYLERKGKSEAAEAKRSELLAKFPGSRYAKLAGQRTMVAAKDPPKQPVKPVDPPKDPPKDPPRDPPKDPPVDPPKDPPVDPSDPGGDPPPVDGGMPEFGNKKVADLVKKGNLAYDEAMIHLEKTFDDATKDSDAENLKALNKFKEACAAYEQAVEIEPKNVWLNERLRQAGENRVMCFLAAKSRK